MIWAGAFVAWVGVSVIAWAIVHGGTRKEFPSPPED